MPEVVIGKDTVTGELITLGDVERQSGFYILGVTGTGKSALQVRMAIKDSEHGHGLFFLDAHGRAIEDFLNRSDIDLNRPLLLDPSDETHTFGINVLACKNLHSIQERTKTSTRAYNIFKKLWAEDWGPLLELFIPHIIDAFIENQEFTLADVPRFLEPTEEPTAQAFRKYIVENMTINPEVADFWRKEFARPVRDQRIRLEAPLTRMRTLLEHAYVRDIVGQRETTVDFADIIENRRIVLVRISRDLRDDVKKFIGTILVSELVQAVFDRPEGHRHQFSVFVDEFQNFADFDDFATLMHEGRKFGVATMPAHQERFGQFGENKAILGATEAAANKMFFRTTATDARGSALELAKPPPARTERGRMISQEPVTELLRGHENEEIREFVRTYLQPLQWRLEDTREDMELERLIRMALLDEAGFYRLDEREQSIDFSMFQRRSPEETDRTLENIRQKLLQAEEQTNRLISHHHHMRRMRLTLRTLNTLLTAIMEGRFDPRPGREAFSQILLAAVRGLSSTPERFGAFNPLELYIGLQYGDPQMMRLIPLGFAERHGLQPEAVSILRQHVAALYELEQEDLEQRSTNQLDDCRQQDVTEVLSWQRNLVENVRGEILISTWKPHLLDIGTAEFIKQYIFLHEYPKIHETLSPYFTARFKPPWNENITGLFHTLLEDVQRFRQENAHGFDAIREHKKWLKERRKQRLSNHCTYYNCYSIKFRTFLLDAFETFLKDYREGAIVTLRLLLNSQYTRFYWPATCDDSTEIRANANRIMPITRHEFPRYPGFYTRYVPAIVGHDPLEIMLFLHRLTGILVACNVRADCGKYYWLAAGYAESYVLALDRIRKLMRRVHLSNHDIIDREIERRLDAGKNVYQAINDSESRDVDRLVDHIKFDPKNLLREFEDRKDLQFLKKILEHKPSLRSIAALAERACGGKSRLNQLVIDYLLCRACDIVRYGLTVADLTFPQPTLTCTTHGEVAESVARIVHELYHYAAETKAHEEHTWLEKRKRHIADHTTSSRQWYEERRLQVGTASSVYVGGRDIAIPRYLPLRVLSTDEQAQLRTACLKDLQQGKEAAWATRVLQLTVDFSRFCRLLSQPENYIWIASTQHTPVNTRPYHDMSDEVAQELIKLPNYTAYLKTIGHQSGTQVVLTRKIETLPLPDLRMERVVVANKTARQNAIDAGMLRERRKIQAEIRARRERWEKRPLLAGPPPLEEPPRRQISPEKTASKRPRKQRSKDRKR